MKIVVVSCYAYRDSWPGFFGLFRKFWPDCPYPIALVTDKYSSKEAPDEAWIWITGDGTPWCKGLADFMESAWVNDDNCLIFQDDFFLNAPVQTDLVQRGLDQLEEHKAGCVRLYPCPGGDIDYGDPRFAIVPFGTRYRISCQAALWDSRYLQKILSACGKTPADFEINGSKLADILDEPVLAFKRDVKPYPLSYIATAIVRGRWLPDAKRLCDSMNIEVDWTQREFQQERMKA